MTSTLVPVSHDNLNLAHHLLENIFPNDLQAKKHFTNSLLDKPLSSDPQIDSSMTIYYLFCKHDVPVGVTGHYQYIQDAYTAWLGWYGILPEKRGLGLGKELLKLTEQICLQKKFKTLCLWTTTHKDEEAACSLYRSMNYQEKSFSEKYSDILVFNKNLDINANQMPTHFFMPDHPGGIDIKRF